MHVQDFDRYPASVVYSVDRTLRPPKSEVSFWFNALEPFNSNDWTNHLYWCPASQFQAADRFVWVSPNPDLARVVSAQGDYGYNSKGSVSDLSTDPLGLDATATGDPLWVSESSVFNPSAMIAIGDSPSGSFLIEPRFNPLEQKLNHRTGVNHVFCDGHVEYDHASRVYAPAPNARRRWNRDNQPHAETWQPEE